MIHARTLLTGALFALSATAFAQTPIAVGDTLTGNLGPGDETLPTGEYVDEYTISSQAGTTVSIRLNSSQFDTYLIVIDPSGQQQDNDDFSGTNSGLDVTLSGGQYRIGATSYAAGETGAYTLSMTAGGGFAAPTTGFAAPTTGFSAPTTGFSAPTTAPVTTAPAGAVSNGGPINVGQTVTGQLQPGDQVNPADNSYMDVYQVNLAQGQSVSIRLNSNDFDTYLIVESPDGQSQSNDDFGSTLNSGMDFVAPAAGTYTIMANSYQAGGVGTYTLSVN